MTPAERKTHAADLARLADMRALGVRWPSGRALPTYTARMTPESAAAADALYDAMSEEFCDAHGRRSSAPVLTYALAVAAGRDAANGRMRAGGRTAWSEGDYLYAISESNRVCREAGTDLATLAESERGTR